MGRYISIITLALLLSGLEACIYSDLEIYEVEPIPGDPPVFSVSTNLDTLHNPDVNDSLEVIYKVEISGGELYYLIADVGSTPVFDSDSTAGSFWILSSYADSLGIDSLYMEFYISSNSNSLADLTGYEALVRDLSIAINFNLEAKK